MIDVRQYFPVVFVYFHTVCCIACIDSMFRAYVEDDTELNDKACEPVYKVQVLTGRPPPDGAAGGSILSNRISVHGCIMHCKILL